VASVPILKTHSPLVVTGYSISIGALLYTLAAIPALVRVEWSTISPLSWTLMVASAVFALAFAYLIWYTSVQKAGSTRTAAWSNVTPVIAMLIAAVWLGEPIALNHVLGSAAIFTGRSSPAGCSPVCPEGVSIRPRTTTVQPRICFPPSRTSAPIE
jgi:drug/metabolite transporter (DMT)-like permease